MKRLILILVCFSILLTAAPLVFADDGSDDLSVYSDEEFMGEYEEYFEDPVETEEPYIDGDTVYDLENETDIEPEPEAEPLMEIPVPEEEEEEIYGDESFDDENYAQLHDAQYVLDEIIIKFKEPWQVPGKEKQLQNEIDKMVKVGFVDQLNLYVVRADDLQQNPNAVLNRLKNNKYIEFVEPNYILRFDYIPNDPKYQTYQSSALSSINAPAGWDILKGCDSVVIAVVDSGIAPHPDLPPLRSGYSVVPGLLPTNDKVGHGTKVAGVIGAVGDNNLGGAGLNWNASIISVKADDAACNLTVANVAKGVIWAADNGAKIINLSIGTTSDSTTLRSAIDYAYNKGCAIFAATGNSNNNSIDYPARYSNVMAIGCGNLSLKSSYSNFGEGINAVGTGAYYTTTLSSGYSNSSGTSFASPQAAGLASLIWSVNPSLSNYEIYNLIEQGASGNGSYNEQTGYGLINIGRTLELAGGKPVSNDPQLPPETSQEARTSPVITLTGFNSLTLEYGQPYDEMGYAAVDCEGLDLTGAVKVTGTVNIWKAGLYTIAYEVVDSTGLTARATRTVTVNPKSADSPPPEAPKITIIGSNPIILHRDSSTPYKEQMARAIDYNGTDLSTSVTVSGSVNRNTAGTYTLTYSVTSPTTGLKASTTRSVRIVTPTEKRDQRAKYSLSGQAKAGAKVTHTGILSSSAGFIDLSVSSIDKNMTIRVQLIDTITGKAVVTDTFSAAGTKQYMIDQRKYELVVTIDKANGNSKYSIDLLMPEAAPIIIYETEVPLYGLTQITPVGSNPIILHVGGTPYFEQGARAVDFLGNDMSGKVEIIGEPDTSNAGTYLVTYRVVNDLGITTEITREVRVLVPDVYGMIDEEEVPLSDLPTSSDVNLLQVCVTLLILLIILVGIIIMYRGKRTPH